MIHIETTRLFLRNYKATDFVDIMKYFADEEVSKYEDFYPMSEYYGNGYATEAGIALVSYLFETENINAIYGDCDVQNITSWKLLERLGFQRIKQFDNQSYKNDKLGNPILISTFLYELDKSNFNVSNK